jgi:tricarboxylate carrier
LLADDAEVKRACDALAAFESNGRRAPPGVSDADLWAARALKESVLHPDTGAPVPRLFRMSAFVLANLPISVGMLFFSHSPGQQLFWQWVNQSYNAGMNYANRNASTPVSTPELLGSYALATGLACGTSLALNAALTRMKARGRVRPGVVVAAERAAPFVAVATAGTANAVAMRWREAQMGVTVTDGSGRVVGVSSTAGQLALAQVVATRVALPMPVLLLPPAITGLLRRVPAVARVLARQGAGARTVEVLIVLACLAGALPAAIALFPQVAAVEAARLEPRFHGLRDPTTGLPIQTLYYNKGL